MRRAILGGSLVVLCLLGASVNAQDDERAAGKQLYQEHCSTCHGMIEADARGRSPGVFPWQQPYAWGQPSATWVLTMTADDSIVPGFRRAVRVPAHLPPRDDSTRLAVAPPYGPPLRGVYGRQAGSVPGFAYSRAFKTALQEVVWERGTLNVWIMDSQAWVAGSTMFYKQPDADIRRKIITYLEAHR
jgi:cytochrome c2